jgi:hypothetical protein
MTIALLVPVPSMHLASAAEQGMSTIGLDTRAWETLQEFEQVGSRHRRSRLRLCVAR